MSSMALSPTAVGRSAVNPWIIAGVVVVPTFMEVLDTTIANVALRYIAGGLSAAQTDSEWVITSLPGRQRHRPADHRLAVGPPRPPQLLPAVDRRLHPRLGNVRLRHQPAANDPVPGDPRAGRRRAPAEQSGGLAGRLPAREAGHGHDPVRGRRHDRAHRRADAGRLALRQLRLAVDLSDQRPDRARWRWSPRTAWSMIPTTSSRSGPSSAASR